jgi:ABC-type multidrug transport system fused ATPase/permease subunit
MFWSQIKRCYSLLETSDKTKFITITFSMSFLGILDLIGVSLLGILSLMLFDTESSNLIRNLFPSSVLLFFEENLYLLAILISFLFLFKSVTLMIVTKFEFSFLAKAQARISAKIARMFYSQSVDKIAGNSSDKVAHNLTSGIDSAVTVILSSVSVFVADLVLILSLSIPLYLFDAPLAVFSFTYFGILAFLVIRYLAPVALAAGIAESHKSIEVTTLVRNMSLGFREISSSFKLDRFLTIFEGRKALSSQYFGLRLFLQQMPKFVFELSLVFGATIFVFIKGSSAAPANEIATSIVVFVAAAFRLAPSLLRLQSAAIIIKSNIGIASSTLDFTDSLQVGDSVSNKKHIELQNFASFTPSISVVDLSFHYQDSRVVLNKLSFNVPAYSSFAIVGESGAGKSTLIDCMLGLLVPTSGEVKISGNSPRQAISNWQHSIAYMPQQVSLLDASIRENIHLDFGVSHDSDEEIFEILNVVQLSDFVSKQPNGLDTLIGENGSMLSGGEKQRLGIARVLYTKPKILFLDEATSSLDPATELVLNNALTGITKFATVVVVAHRLSTIKEFEQILYLEGGSSLGIGTFEQLRNTVPKFKQQCMALGL